MTAGAASGGEVLFFATGADLTGLDWEAKDVAGLVRLVRKRGGTVHYPPQPPRTCPDWWRQLALAVVACVNVRRHGDSHELALGCARHNRRWYEDRQGYSRPRY